MERVRRRRPRVPRRRRGGDGDPADVGHLAANVATYGPHATETPLPLRDDAGNIVFPGFPADVLAEFRLYAIGAQALLWAGIGLLFAPMAEKVLQPAPGPPRPPPRRTPSRPDPPLWPAPS